MNKKPVKQRSPKRRCDIKTRNRQYRIRNWKQYNQALKQRGSLTVWVDEEAVLSWHNLEKSGARGASQTYSESAIVCALTVHSVYHLALRATEGFLISLFALLQVELRVPDYSTLSRRRKTLEVTLQPHRLLSGKRGQNLHLVVDSSGFKIYGEGEWKVRQHGWSKRRSWRKLHLGIDEASQQIMAAVCSTNEWSDGEVLPLLLEQIEEPLEQVTGDGGYDSRACYEAIEEKKARAVIPPRRGARIQQRGNSSQPSQRRDEHVRRIRKVGRKRWKQESGYHRRSLAETAFARLKGLFGEKFSARLLKSQAVESFIRCAALNKMTALGMPQTVEV